MHTPPGQPEFISKDCRIHSCFLSICVFRINPFEQVHFHHTVVASMPKTIGGAGKVRDNREK